MRLPEWIIGSRLWATSADQPVAAAYRVGVVVVVNVVTGCIAAPIGLRVGQDGLELGDDRNGYIIGLGSIPGPRTPDQGSLTQQGP